MADATLDDPRMSAALELIRRTGCATFQLRYSDDDEPTVWMAVGQWYFDKGPKPVRSSTPGAVATYETGAALHPYKAVIRLLEQILDGVGTCAHCGRHTAISDDFTIEPGRELDEALCWYIFDPETETFRRSCEGET